MIGRLFLLFTLTALAELYILVKLTAATSLGFTLMTVIVTGMVGAALARREGARVLRGIQEDTAAGRIPTDGLLDGLTVLIAGVMLLTPGLLTDLAGFLLLVPAARAPLRAAVRRAIERRIEAGSMQVVTMGQGPTGRGFGGGPFGGGPFAGGPFAGGPFPGDAGPGGPFSERSGSSGYVRDADSASAQRPRSTPGSARGGYADGQIIDVEVVDEGERGR